MLFALLLNLPWEFAQMPLYAETARMLHWAYSLEVGHKDAKLPSRFALTSTLVLTMPIWRFAVGDDPV